MLSIQERNDPLKGGPFLGFIDICIQSLIQALEASHLNLFDFGGVGLREAQCEYAVFKGGFGFVGNDIYRQKDRSGE